MILYTTDYHGFESLIMCDSGHIRPEFRLKIFGDALLSILRAENDVEPVARISVRHFVSSLRDLPSLLNASQR